MDINITVYTVCSGYMHDECEDDIIGSFLSKKDAENALYKNLVEQAISTGGKIERSEFDDEHYLIDSYYTYIREDIIRTNS